MPGKVTPWVALQFQIHCLFTTSKPDFANHTTGRPVVNFTTGNLFFNAPCHTGRLVSQGEQTMESAGASA